MGNVALDVARIMAKTAEEFAGPTSSTTRSTARRQPNPADRGGRAARAAPDHDDPKELGESGYLSRAAPGSTLRFP